MAVQEPARDTDVAHITSTSNANIQNQQNMDRVDILHANGIGSNKACRADGGACAAGVRADCRPPRGCPGPPGPRIDGPPGPRIDGGAPAEAATTQGRGSDTPPLQTREGGGR